MNRVAKIALIALPFLTVFWLTFGRGLFGSHGYYTFLFIFIGIGILIALLVLGFLILNLKSFKLTKKIPREVVVLVAMVYVSIFAYSFFLIDGDSTHAAASIGTNILGSDFLDTSFVLEGIFKWIAIVLVVLAYGAAIRRHVLESRNK